MIKHTLVLTLLIFAAASAQNVQAKTLIVSDVDDTIKITDVLGKTSTLVFNGLFRSKAFSGMSELYQSMNKADTTFFYVSGSPRIIKFRVQEFLEDNQFPGNKNTILKNNTDSDTLNFKISAIRGLIASETPDQVILIGDDTEHDPEVYNTISKEYPGLVKATYIRSVQNSAVFGTTFFSAVEIAAHEINQGRLAARFLPIVTDGFVRQTYRSGVAIKNRYCPKEGRIEIEELKQRASEQSSIDSLENAQAKIIKSCN